jgi:hypothetical protein
MAKYRYKGTISEVGMKGKGVVKRGDIVNFSDAEAASLSPENWEKVETTFDHKLQSNTGHVRKRVFSRSRREEDR